MKIGQATVWQYYLSVNLIGMFIGNKCL